MLRLDNAKSTDIRRMPPLTTANTANVDGILQAGCPLGEQVLRNRDLGHLERDMAGVDDDLRAHPNRRWAIAHGRKGGR